MEIFDRLNETILTIHKLPEQVPFEAFRDEILKHISYIIPFKSAWWGLSAELDILDAATIGLPANYQNDWFAFRSEDIIAEAALKRPMTSQIFNSIDLDASPNLKSFLNGYGIEHVLCTTTQEAYSGLSAFLSLYRSDAPFNEAERKAKQLLMPHLMHALGQSWRQHLENTLASLADARVKRVAAIVNARGLILSTRMGLTALISNEWPDWTGPFLPNDLNVMLKPNGRYVGRDIELRCYAVKDHFILTCSAVSLQSTLTDRELAVSELFAAGESYKSVSRKLGISPATVRHHLRNTYGKLHVSDKAQLATLLSGSAKTL